MSRDLPQMPEDSLEHIADALTGHAGGTPLTDTVRHLDRIATALEKLVERQEAREEREREGR